MSNLLQLFFTSFLLCVSFPSPKFVITEGIFIVSVSIGCLLIVPLPYDFILGYRFCPHFLFLNSGYTGLYPTILVTPGKSRSVFFLFKEFWTSIDYARTVCIDNENIIVTILCPGSYYDRSQFITCWFIIIATAGKCHSNKDTQSYRHQRL